MVVMENMEPLRLIVKKHTDPIGHLDSTDWRWSTVELQWQRKISEEPDIWVRDHPPLPEWFINSGGVVTPSTLASLWNEASSVAMLKREVFWLSLEELECMLSALTEIEAPVVEDSKGDLGVSSTKRGDEQALYDPMRAILDAQEGRPFNPQHQFETIEGGRFRAKH